MGCHVGAHSDGLALHQRAAAVGHGEPQRSPGAVLQHVGGADAHRSPALPSPPHEKIRAAEKVHLSVGSRSIGRDQIQQLFPPNALRCCDEEKAGHAHDSVCDTVSARSSFDTFAVKFTILR